jgi:hypothetical protein
MNGELNEETQLVTKEPTATTTRCVGLERDRNSQKNLNCGSLTCCFCGVIALLIIIIKYVC